MAQDRVGIIGPGRMGLAMLKHLTRHGFDVSVYDVNDEQLAKAVEAGGIQTNSPREVGKNSDYVIVGVGFEPEVYACLTGDDGALAGMAPGCAIAVCSTASVSGVQELARLCEDRGIGFLDAPTLEAAGPQTRAPCWPWSAARRKSLNAPARYSRRSAPTSNTWAMLATARLPR